MTSRQGHGIIPKHKMAKKSRTKPKPKQSIKKSIPSKPKLRQTRLNLSQPPIPQTQPRDLPAPSSLRTGRIERIDQDHSLLGTAVISPSNFRQEMYSDASPLQLDKAASFVTSSLENLSKAQSEEMVSWMDEPNSSPTPSPAPVRSGIKRKHQSRIDLLFLPDTGSSERKITRVVLSDSESDSLGNIHLEPERKNIPQEVDPPSDAESEILVGPRARRQRHLPSSSPVISFHRSPSPATESNEDLKEEVRDITSSARKSPVLQRTRDVKSRNKRKSQFQKNLENLRKKKQGLQTDSDEESEKGRALYDSENDANSVASEDFVVEDNQELTLEEMMEIPPEFTSVSYQGTQLNFKVVVQGEVYALLHPNYHALDYSDHVKHVHPYFRHAFKSLEKQVNGITDSAISSNAWKPWFIKALRSRPEFESEEIPGDIADCDACNITRRHATFLARLTGPKYNPRTMEIIEASNESECYWDNKDKQFLSPQDVNDDDIEEGLITKVNLNREWALGQFCHSRAEIAHYFYHWRYHLREQVKYALRQIGYLNGDKMNYISNLPPDIREQALDDVMDLLDRKRHISRMYKEYRMRISMAQEYLTGGGRGWQSSPQGKRFIRG